LTEVNGNRVKTLKDFRNAVLEGTQGNILIIKAHDNSGFMTGEVLLVLPLDEVIQEENWLSQMFKYPISDLVGKLGAKLGQ